MIIEQLFQEDINHKINGVVKVDQDATDVLVQELDEYVITRDAAVTLLLSSIIMENPSVKRPLTLEYGFPVSCVEGQSSFP